MKTNTTLGTKHTEKLFKKFVPDEESIVESTSVPKMNCKKRRPVVVTIARKKKK